MKKIICILLLAAFLSAPCAPSFAESVTLKAIVSRPKTGGLPKTGQTISYPSNDTTDRDDGHYQAGWNGPGDRFTDNGNGTITDNATGLMWQQTASANPKTWAQAITYCETLSLGGYSAGSWRLPNINELMSIVDYNDGRGMISTVFQGGRTNWTSTTALYTDLGWADPTPGSQAFIVGPVEPQGNNGAQTPLNRAVKTYSGGSFAPRYYARAVRGPI